MSSKVAGIQDQIRENILNARTRDELRWKKIYYTTQEMTFDQSFFDGDVDVTYRNVQRQAVVALGINGMTKNNEKLVRERCDTKNHYDFMKLRAKQATVLGIFSPSGSLLETGYSSHDHTFLYPVGKIVKCTRDFDHSNTACAPGIHYYRHPMAAKLVKLWYYFPDGEYPSKCKDDLGRRWRLDYEDLYRTQDTYNIFTEIFSRRHWDSLSDSVERAILRKFGIIS